MSRGVDRFLQRRNFPRGGRPRYRAFAFRCIDIFNVVDKRKRCKEIDTNGGKREGNTAINSGR